jgi:hypothetical protein
MGGNSRIIDRYTGNVIGRAEKIDLSKFSRNKTTVRLYSLFHFLNEHFYEKFSRYLWENFEVVTSGQAFSGSSKFFFDRNISDEIFKLSKPIVGDIDIMIPEDCYTQFSYLMQDLEKEDLAWGIKYLGQDRNNFGTTFLAVFELIEGKNRVNFQIDFEAVEWKHDQPTEWAKFSHNSAWEDIEKGFKGVHHKFLLINLIRAVSKREDILIATSKSTPENVRLISGKKSDQIPRILAFSVDKGLRVKYKQMMYNDGMPVIIDDKFVYQEIAAEDSLYITDVREIYETIFTADSLKPSFSIYEEEDIQIQFDMFFSFVGLMELMQLYIDADVIKDCFNFALQENLFGKHAQIIEKNDPDMDYHVKMKFIRALWSEFRYLRTQGGEVEQLASEYKKNFKFEL